MADSQISILSLTVTAGVRLNLVRWTVEIGSCLPYMQLAVYEVWGAASNNRAAAIKLGDTTDLRFVHPGLTIGVPRYYWVRAKDQSNNLSDFFPLSATSGAVGIPVSTGPGSIGEDELGEGAVTPTKIAVDELAAISGNMGTLTLGKLLSADGKFLIDLTNKRIKITK